VASAAMLQANASTESEFSAISKPHARKYLAGGYHRGLLFTGRASTRCRLGPTFAKISPIDRFWICVPLPLVGNSLKPATGPGEAVPALSRPGERAEPATKQSTLRSHASSDPFEGQRQDRRAIAERVATYGLKVFCTDCGLMSRHRQGGERLRHIASVCCGARMHPARWGGWGEWRRGPRALRREEPAAPADPHVVRKGGNYFMSGLDS